MSRIRTCVLKIATVAAFGLVGSGAWARGGEPDPAQVEAVEAIERVGGWVSPQGLLFPGGCVVVIEGTTASDGDLVHLKRLKDLWVLGLDGTKITDAGLAHVGGVKSLKVLGLKDTQVTDAGIARLKGLEHLRELDLKGTQVSDAGVDQLAQLKHLRKLTISGTRISSEGKKKLRRSLPWCRVR